MPGFQLKRIHDPVAADDGQRILVERLWPRGIKKEQAALDDWFKEIAPSTELRKWYGHDPERWPDFRQYYRAELADQPQRLADLRQRARAETVTLLFAARDRERNSANVLKEVLEEDGPPGP